MNDKIGKIPKIESKDQALKEIIKICNDKRTHVTLYNCLDWGKLKMKVIRIIAKRGLKIEDVCKCEGGCNG